MTSQMLEKLNVVEFFNKLPTPHEGMMNTPREDILIAGVFRPAGKVQRYFPGKKNGWFEVSEVREKHNSASSFLYQDQLFVVGGRRCKKIDTLDLKESSSKWIKFPGELSYVYDDHKIVVYQQRIIHIGGHNYHELKASNVISELQLSSPCIMKELCEMPEPRECHCAEIFEDKVLIMGGTRGFGDFLDSVLKFDVTKNEYTEMPSLPGALRTIATVRWRDKVAVLGGRDEDGNILNDVFMYDCNTGKTTTLPSMLEKRCEFCAVITGNTIIVMGGVDNDNETLSSVEYFTMGGSTWEYLPAMNKARWGAIAHVLPSTRKYV